MLLLKVADVLAVLINLQPTNPRSGAGHGVRLNARLPPTVVPGPRRGPLGPWSQILDKYIRFVSLYRSQFSIYIL